MSERPREARNLVPSFLSSLPVVVLGLALGWKGKGKLRSDFLLQWRTVASNEGTRLLLLAKFSFSKDDSFRVFNEVWLKSPLCAHLLSLGSYRRWRKFSTVSDL